jgi:hypothetical protein
MHGQCPIITSLLFFIDIQQVKQGERDREREREREREHAELAQPYTDKNTLELPEIANSTKFAWLIMILSLLSQQI